MEYYLVLLLMVLVCSCKRKYSKVFEKDTVTILKAFLAIGIVFKHVAERTSIPVFSTLFCQWGPIIVAVFLFISGYGLHYSYSHKGNAYFEQYFSRRIGGIVRPFIISIVIYQIGLLCFGDFSWSKLVIDLSKGDTNTLLPFSWYIFLIIYFYLIFYFIFRKEKTFKRQFIYVCLFTAIYIGIVLFVGFKYWWWNAALAFPIGIIYQQYEVPVSKFLFTNKRVIICSLGLIIVTYILLKLNQYGSELLGFAVLPVMTVLILNLAYDWLSKLKENKIVTYLSSISLEIYLAQGVPILLLRNKSFYIESDYLYLISVMLMTFLIAISVKRACGITFMKN